MKNFLGKLSLIFLLVSTFNLQLKAQEKCATMLKHDDLMLKDAAYRSAFLQAEQVAHKEELSMKASRVQGIVYKIPVVVHILHVGEAIGTNSNITDDQIYGAITSLNNAYRKKAGTRYDANGVDVEIEFCLAQKGPTGAASTGINRVNAGSAIATYATDGITNANEISVKALSKWDNTRYYNIWVVSEIDNNGAGSGTQGYAYLAPAPSDRDGMVVLYNSFGYDPEGSRGYNLKSYTNKNITTIHELGHSLGLYHTFQGDASGCPTNANCSTDGDKVCDTPPHLRSSSDCVMGLNSCDNNSSRELFIHNYMDYSSDDCQTEFTAGQASRARSVLTSVRSNLVSATNLLLCGCSSNTAPIARFYADEKMPCEGTAVNFIDESLNAPATYNWTFAGGTPSTSTAQNPSVVFTGVGPYTVSLNVAAVNTLSNTNTKSAYISPIAATFTTLPLAESFEGTFPPTDWTIESTDVVATTAWGTTGAKKWESRGSIVGSDAGVQAAAINLYDYSDPSQKDDLVLPLINLTTSNAATLTFKVAFRYYSQSSTDTLLVLGSTNCGKTFTEVYRKGGANLSTGLLLGSAFSPASTTDWRLETVDLASFAGKNVQLRFRSVNDYGNNLYIDDVNITAVEGPLAVEASQNLNIKVYPNPTKDLVHIQLQDEEEVSVEVVNTVSNQVLTSQKGSSNITIDLTTQPQGLYLIIVKTAKGNMVSRVAKTN